MADAISLAAKWHVNFNRFAGDLYPGRYSYTFCRDLAELAVEVDYLAREKHSLILAHYYQHPEFHEIAHRIGDSLALSEYAKTSKSPRVDFVGVAFMAQTAKMITRNQTRVYIGDTPQILGCSLVFGTDHAWIENWKKDNPGGQLVTYINGDLYTKSLSSFISTSRNTDKIIAYAVKNNPDKKILVLPDKFLAHVMKARAVELLRKSGISVDPTLIEIYDHAYNGYNSCCYVHEKLGNDAVDVAMIENPDAELMIHPECGCASHCLLRMEESLEIRKRAYFLSTEQMIKHAIGSSFKKFIVATEMGLLYQLRKKLPEKTFISVAINPTDAQCDFMKANTLEKLLASLREDKLEIIICEECPKCLDPRHPYQDKQVVHIPRKTADLAQQGIDRMLAIQ